MTDDKMHEWLQSNGYINYEDYDRLEDKLLDLGFLHSRSTPITDLEGQLTTAERLIAELLQRTSQFEIAFKYLLMNKITGYSISTDGRLHLSINEDQSNDPMYPPTILKQVEKIIEYDEKQISDAVDLDQPWLN